MVELCFSIFLLFFGGLGTDGQLVFQCLVAFLWWVGSGADQYAARSGFELETALEFSV